MFLEYSKVRKMIQQWYKLLLALHTARAKLINVANSEHRIAEIERTQHSPLAKLSHWHITDVWVYPALRVDSSRYCLWGGTYAKAITHWMINVRWPTEHIVTEQDPGITWIELFTSFVHHTGLLVPLKRSTDSNEILIAIDTKTDIETFGAKFSEMVAAFTNMIAQLRDLTDPWLWPDIPRGFAKSTYQLGSSVQSSGFRIRPMMPCQIQTMATLQRYFATNKGPSFCSFPDLPLGGVYDTAAIRRELLGDLVAKDKRVHQEAKKLRQWRKSRQIQLRFGQ